ncbi:FtsW/RodA/SpoVE family cell cycle protein [uncultured Thermosynechococcus sp.]|uniref:FtsW/RodA/SpoVE family cell cycle protein n=1 Tax=uncultured Thermosynechococcus sp. TaxID=436945 RepID=UPI00260D1EC9|nr:FtsW/RodA/SpoVE family cell cycle protein [uncultured Thermosynechococcus sp.]
MGSHWLVYGLSCVLLLAVDLVGVEAKGAERWLAIGGFNLQPPAQNLPKFPSFSPQQPCCTALQATR